MQHSFVRAWSDLSDDEISPEPTQSPTTDVSNETGDARLTKHYVIAVDFGTTFSAVAFAILRPGDERELVDVDEITCISNYPTSVSGLRGLKLEVPTEMCYRKTPIHRDNRSFFDIRSKRALESDDDVGDEEDSRNSRDTGLDEMDIDMRETTAAVGINPKYIWGYGVHQHFQHLDADRTTFQRVTRSKLLLDNSERTKFIRQQLQHVIRELKEIGTIRNGMNLIVDFLTQLFVHTKQQLCQFYRFKDTDSVEFVLCVPVIWKRAACRRMQNAIREASYRSGLGKVISDSVENLYIVSEPEAAAARVLATTREIQAGDIFMILDAGGGTVDAITYRLRSTNPLRMEKEEVTPEGALCGSSYLNEEFENLLREKLHGEDYLIDMNGLNGLNQGITIDGIIANASFEFENVKRNVNVRDPNFPGFEFSIYGLRTNKDKKFTQNRALFDRDDFKRIFFPCLNGVSQLMLSQLDSARARGIIVKKILLVGGFAASPSLYRHLEKTLQKRSKEIGSPIDLLCDNIPEIAVASGAVLRALNREHGPTRIIQSSYGFLRNEPWSPERIDAHRHSKPKRADPNDGDRYVKNTIYWVIKKGEEVPPFKEYSLPSIFTFPARKNQRFICEEVLYVSDKRHESHYKKGHKNNLGAKVAGTIVVDMTFLRTKGYIQPIKPEHTFGRLHYRVEYELVMIVDGLNIRYEARWRNGQEVHVLGQEQINIAAAFASLEPDDKLDDEDGYLTD